MLLTTPVAELHRVGKTLSKRLSLLGIHTVGELLHHFPFRYEDFSQTIPIEKLQDGMQVTVKGKIELIANKRSPRKRVMITEAVVVDDTDRLRVVWFGQPFIAKNLKVGDMVYLSGKVSGDAFGKTMTGPTYERSAHQHGTTHTARIVPMYPLTAGITQKQLRFLMKQVIPLAKKIDEWLPEEIRDKADIMPQTEAMEHIHFPTSTDDLTHAQRRLKFDELFLLQLRAELIRQSLQRQKAPRIPFHEKAIQSFVASLPFTLTKSQKVAAWEIFQDCESVEPMNRLLEGDVGSGKTIVAAMTLYNAVISGYQGVIMAPTDILAKQHFVSLQDVLPKEVRIGVLTRTVAEGNWEVEKKVSKKKQRESLVEMVNGGEVDIVIGTHALLQEDVQFANLGFTIVDEQHRFGVAQRKAIRDKSGDPGTTPHFLSMTATPIPRSFALTVYGDLDVSMMTDMPQGRKPVKTRVVEPKHRSKAYQFIHEQVEKGRQCFVICPHIEGKDGEKKSVLTEYEKLSNDVFPSLRVGFVHGKLKAKEKDGVMQQFAAGELDVLVSTSVVEVGVNIPNASVMMIEQAERFGLAQLHQFRGRVGRSEHQSYCFLFTESDSKDVLDRLNFFEQHTNGFTIAEYDLERRGPGEVYGVNQSGMMNLKIANFRDIHLIKLARDTARGIDFETYPKLKERVEGWERSVHLE